MSQRSSTSELREKLAAVQHEIWSHWTRYLFSICTRSEDGSLTIPADEADRWMRQMMSTYENLSDQERESDREQADRVLKVLRAHGT